MSDPILQTVHATLLQVSPTPLGHLSCELDANGRRYSAVADRVVADTVRLQPGARLRCILLRLRLPRPDGHWHWQLMACQHMAAESGVDPSPFADLPSRSSATLAESTRGLIRRMLPLGGITGLHGRLARIGHDAAGSFVAVLDTSIGEFEFRGKSDQVPAGATIGTWMDVRLSCLTARTMPRAGRIALVPQGPGVWSPDESCLRTEHLRRLRLLLGDLSLPAQVLFMAALGKLQDQARWFRRIAAVDHHVYPGGLFDQSVHAAELADAYSVAHERDVAVLAALLHDIGKIDGKLIESDEGRATKTLDPHPLTHKRVHKACRAVESIDPQLTANLAALLWPEQAKAGLPDLADLRERVRRSVSYSWSVGRRGLAAAVKSS